MKSAVPLIKHFCRAFALSVLLASCASTAGPSVLSLSSRPKSMRLDSSNTGAAQIDMFGINSHGRSVRLAQTTKVNQDGKLAKIVIGLNIRETPAGPVVLEIRKVDGAGFPSDAPDAVLASASVNLGSANTSDPIGGEARFQRFALPKLALTKGQIIALVVYTTSNITTTGGVGWFLSYDDTDTNQAGRAASKLDNDPWRTFGRDYYFQTYFTD